MTDESRKLLSGGGLSGLRSSRARRHLMLGDRRDRDRDAIIILNRRPRNTLSHARLVA